jgi:hypothetical protein
MSRPQFALTGEVAHNQGRWTLPLNGMVNRRLWVQLLAADHYVSAPVEIVLDVDNCDQNQVELIFEQTAPLSRLFEGYPHPDQRDAR